MDPRLTYLAVLLFTFSFFAAVQSTEFTVVNQCWSTIWPGIQTYSRTRTSLTPSGFILKSNESKTLSVPNSWNGAIWGRTNCSTDTPTTGNFSCLTGDCGAGKVECNGSRGPPATLAELSVNVTLGFDFYDVSLVEGFNLPILVLPKNRNCRSTSCLSDLNAACPRELRVERTNGSRRETVACMSACYAFKTEVHCCRGGQGQCQLTLYSSFFKDACPHAYSYAMDDRTGKFTCAPADYSIIFCPPANNSGYMAPEYAMDGIFSMKSDVFSFGVMMLEIISGKKNTAFYNSDHHINLLGYVWDLWNEEKFSEIVDPNLAENSPVNEILRHVQIGLLCVQEDARDRPTMSVAATIYASK